MRIERVNEDKIKVMIDGQEAEKLKLSFHNISKNTPEAQRLLRIAIKMAEENVDFSVHGKKLFVEAVRDVECDGFGMLITRVANEEELHHAIAHCSYQGTLKKSKVHLAIEEKGEKGIFCFSDFEHACMAAEELMARFSGISSLYKYQSKFYLCLVSQSCEKMQRFEPILLEFGEKAENSCYMEGRLHEYGELMIGQNALEVMKEYFPIYELNH